MQRALHGHGGRRDHLRTAGARVALSDFWADGSGDHRPRRWDCSGLSAARSNCPVSLRVLNRGVCYNCW